MNPVYQYIDVLLFIFSDEKLQSPFKKYQTRYYRRRLEAISLEQCWWRVKDWTNYLLQQKRALKKKSYCAKDNKNKNNKQQLDQSCRWKSRTLNGVRLSISWPSKFLLKGPVPKIWTSFRAPSSSRYSEKSKKKLKKLFVQFVKGFKKKLENIWKLFLFFNIYEIKK